MTESSPETGHAPRLVFEQLGQMLVVASGFLDRLVLTALLLRSWEVTTFEEWSTCIALASMISLFEFGLNLHFNNQIMIEMEKGDLDALRSTYSTGNGLFLICAVVGFATLVFAIFAWEPLGAQVDDGVIVAAILLCGANSAKIALCSVNALYRANRDYGRFAFVLGTSELARISLVIAAVALGGSIVEAAVASTLATTLVSVVFVVFDTRRRYFPHAYSIRLPHRRDVRTIAGSSSLYMAQAVPAMLFLSMPVIVLQKMALAPGLIAGFIIVRTLSNLARAPLQSAGIVFGQETGRRIAIGDSDGALQVTRRAARLFAVLSGLASGILMTGGESLTRLWIGSDAHFDKPLLVVATVPMILTPIAAVLIHNILVSHQAPLMPAVARGAQLLVTLFTYAVASDLDAPIRIMLALSIGEVLGFAPIAYFASAQLIPGLTLSFLLRNLARAVAATIIAALVTHFLLWLEEPVGNSAVAATFALIGALLAVVAVPAGVDRDGRRRLAALIVRFVRRNLRRFGREGR